MTPLGKIIMAALILLVLVPFILLFAPYLLYTFILLALKLFRSVRNSAWKNKNPAHGYIKLVNKMDGMYYEMFVHSVDGQKPVFDSRGVLLPVGKHQLNVSYICADSIGGLCTFPIWEIFWRTRMSPFYPSGLNMCADLIRNWVSVWKSNANKGGNITVEIKPNGIYSLRGDAFEKTVVFSYEEGDRHGTEVFDISKFVKYRDII